MEKGIALERFEYIRSLYRRHLAHALSGREHDELMRFFDTCTEDELQRVVGKLTDETDEVVPVTADQERRADAVFGRIAGVTGSKPRKTFVRRLSPWLAAASVILVAGVALFFHFAPKTGIGPADVQPGGNRATLTLADGRVIDLDEAQTGIVVGAEDITYQDGVSLGLSPAGEPVPPGREGKGRLEDIEELTLATPKGGTYQVTLPDGSKVWLNSASTLKYPSRFSENSREVILEGEAFFEIQPQAGNARGSVGANDHSPFSVQTANQTVSVLGTQFNISAYADEPETKTTLVDGKVRVVGHVGAHDHAPGKSSVILSPGEQSVTRGAETIVQDVDVNQYVAWRDGYFHFGESLERIMEQLARWYDITVVYTDGVDRKQEFGGRISRDKPISAALRIMAMTEKVSFRIEENATGERRVVVMP